MLQQTQVDTVIPFYERFTSRFPTVEKLAQAEMGEVLKVWENMGYYARARHMHAAAKEMVRRGAGVIPDTWEGLMSLPGIGPYTAGAILSIAYGRKVPAVDGNVRRVLSRIFALRDNGSMENIREKASRLLPEKEPGRFNQAVMELGATVCLPRNPRCEVCPLWQNCGAYGKGIQDQLPAPKKRGAVPHRQMTAAVIRDGRDRLLIARRPEQGLLGGLWKLPGGEKKGGESLEAALARSVREEVGIRVRVAQPLVSVRHAYTHFRITLHGYSCHRLSGRTRPRARGCVEWRWAADKDLGLYAFSRADRKVLEGI
jgi:A/G-specific adenine glycosylase